MKTKKHKTGYRTGDVAKHDLPFPIINGPKPRPGPKPPILWVKKDGKLKKATEDEVDMAKKRWIKGRPSTVKRGSKYVKKGGKV